MSTELQELASGIGFQLSVDGSRPLAQLVASVNGLCDRVEDRADRTIVVLRLTATPPGLRAWPGDVRIQEVSRWERAVRRLARLTAVNIAVAEGVCGGPALDLLLATDFRICAPDMRLLLPINDGHFWPGMSMYGLVQQLGIARARQIVLWSDEFAAEPARSIGLVDQVTADVPDAIHTATVLMGRVSDAELAVRRQLMFEATSANFEDALGVHLAACDRELRRLRDQSDPDRPARRYDR